MRYRSAGKLLPEHVGRRVTVRRSLQDGSKTDIVGELLSITEEQVTVRNRRGDPETVPLSEVVAARVIEPRS